MMTNMTRDEIRRDQSVPGASNIAGSAAKREPAFRPVRVWDLPTRFFHWAIVVLLAALYVTWRANWMNAHVLSGEILLALILFRILWGFFGTETSLFVRFAASPVRAFRHLATFGHRESDTGVGHNPAGAWVVFTMLGLLLAEVLTGLYVNNDVANEGPFTEFVPAPVANAITDLHAILWNIILALVVLHILAIAAYAIVKGHDLVRPMINGNKCLPETIAAPRLAPLWRAGVLLALAAAAAAFISYTI